MRIVADAAIPHVEACLAEAAGIAGTIERVPGSRIGAAAVRDADALLVRSVTRVDEALVAGSSLRFVGSATAGVDHVDVDALARRGIAFGHSPGCNANAVVHYVCTAIHHVALHHDPGVLSQPIGIVGFGNVGRRLAQRLRAMGLEVLANDPPLQAACHSPEAFVPLDDLLAACTLVSLHVPLTRSHESAHPTHHLLDAGRVRRAMGRGVCLINTSRGGVLDEAPLLARSGAPGRVVLDVWEHEPQLRWPLLAPGAPTLLATPHVAGYSLEGKREATRLVVESLAAALELTPSPLPPAPAVDEILVADPGLSPTQAVAAALMRSCDLVADDASVRRLLDLPEPERAAAFEAQRANYPLRREPGAWRVRATTPAVAAALTAAGFRIA